FQPGGLVIFGYSPPPKRRDHHPALRGCASEVSAAGVGSAAGDGAASGALCATGAGASAAGAPLLAKETFSRTVERRGAGFSCSGSAAGWLTTAGWLTAVGCGGSTCCSSGAVAIGSGC